jgi:DNA-binding SARP family transcriptional activator
LRWLGRLLPPRGARDPMPPMAAGQVTADGRDAGAPAGALAGPGAGRGPRRGANAAGPPRVEARLLGPFELLVNGQQVQRWRGNRGRMLLAFLLLNRGRPLARDEFGTVFWPDAAPDVVRNRLHVALYGLRRDLRALCPHPIVVHGQRGFSLHPSVEVWLDTEAFEEAVSAARREQSGSQDRALTWYERALELYRGELLEDAPFEDWALLRRERLRLRYLDALDQVATLRFAAGRYADCLDVCQRLIPGDLCREEIHRLVMRSYARLNQPHLAIRQYRQCERQLRDELGIEPAQSTQHLYERIRRRELVLPSGTQLPKLFRSGRPPPVPSPNAN